MTVVIVNFPEATPGCSCATCEAIREANQPKYQTKSGKMLSDREIWDLSAEAEQGYDPEQIIERFRRTPPQTSER